MSRGRKKQPDQLKRLKGTDQPCRMTGDMLPGEGSAIKEVYKLPPAPKILNKWGKRVYRKLGASFAQVGVVNDYTINSFIILCNEMGTYLEIEEELKELDKRYDIVFDKNGNSRTVPSALHKMSRDLFASSVKMLTEFGLTPASISRLTVKDNDDDGFDDFIDG